MRLIGTPFKSEIRYECCCVYPYESESEDDQEDDGDELSDHEGGVHLQPAVVLACTVRTRSDIAVQYGLPRCDRPGWPE